MKPFTQKVIPTAQRETGVREVPPGSNCGPRVEEFLRSIGLRGGPPWCAALVFFVINEVARFFGVTNPWPRTGYCPLFERFARNNHILFEKPQAGDVFLFYGAPEGRRRACHTGFVVSVSGDTFRTVEGNTNDGGSRDGVGVFQRKRTLEPNRYKFIRLDAVAPDVTKLQATPSAKPGVPVPVAAPSAGVRISTPLALVLSGRKILDLPVRDGRAWCPIKVWCRALNFTCEWNQEKQLYEFDGKEAPLDVLKIEVAGAQWAYAPIRQLVRLAGLKMSLDAKSHRVVVSK